MFDGNFEKGCGNKVFDYSNTIDLFTGQVKSVSPPPLCTSKNQMDVEHEIKTSSSNDDYLQQSSAHEKFSPLLQQPTSESCSVLEEYKHLLHCSLDNLDINKLGKSLLKQEEEDNEIKDVEVRRQNSSRDQQKPINEFKELSENSPSNPDHIDLDMKVQLGKNPRHVVDASSNKSPQWLSSLSNFQQNVHNQSYLKLDLDLTGTESNRKNTYKDGENTVLNDFDHSPISHRRDSERNERRKNLSTLSPRSTGNDYECKSTKSLPESEHPVSGRRKKFNVVDKRLDGDNWSIPNMPTKSKFVI